MQVKEVQNEILGERYFEIDHPSGLKIYIMPKKNYSSSYALFGTKYGSIDTMFKRSDEASFTTVPEGIAHFLEHKLFESEELDAFERFAKTGASANAYTSFDKTCYLFSCSDNFEASLEILLDFVQHPYFTKETVEKEQGIIGQEIRMYDDIPGWMVEFNLLKALYKNHPVRIDIAGTVDSIAQITDTLLYKCYNTFYNLNNMALCVVGNVEVDTVLSLCDKLLVPAKELSIERSFPEEPRAIVCDYMEHTLPVSVPVFALGFKEVCAGERPDLKEILVSNVLLDIIAGNTTPVYKELFEGGLINTSFSREFFYGHGYACMMFEGESNDPARVADRIKEEILRFRRKGIDENIFECVRRRYYGMEIMSYNDIDSIANSVISCDFGGYELFDTIKILKEMTLQDVENRFKEVLDEKYAALSVVKSK